MRASTGRLLYIRACMYNRPQITLPASRAKAGGLRTCRQDAGTGTTGVASMVKKTKGQALETRRSILDAAIDVFFEKGVSGASLEEIAERAGVTRGAIYWHFKNKLDIFEALHDDLHLSVMETILQDLETDHPDPLRQLKNLCTALLLDLERDQKRHRVLTVFFMKCDYSGDMAVFQDRQNAHKLKGLELFSQYIQRAKAHGHLDDNVDPDTVTLALSFYLTGIMHEHLRDPLLCNLTAQAPQFMEQFFRGVLSRP